MKQRTYVLFPYVSRGTATATPHNHKRCYHEPVNLRRASLIGAVLLIIPLLTACVGVSSPEGWAPPVVDGDDLYVTTNKGHLARVTLGQSDIATARWTFPDKDLESDKRIEPVAIYGEPVLDGDVIYVATFHAGVFALNAGDGRPIWPLPGETNVRRINGDLTGGLTLHDGILYFGTTEGRLYAWRASDGVAAAGWEEPRVFDRGIWATPVIVDSTLFVATMSGELHALSLPDGQPLWNQPFTTKGAIPEIFALEDGQVFATSADHNVYIIDAATGAEISSYAVGDWAWTTPALSAGSLFFGDFAGLVHGLDISNERMSQLWTPAELGETTVKAGAIVIDGVLIIADRRPVVTFVDAATGQVLNRVPIDGAGTIRADVVPSGDGTAYILTTRGNLYRANPANRSVVEIQLSGVKR